MKNHPLISLSIVSHGDSEKIIQLLSSLQKHEQDTKRFQLIFTDNLGNDLPNFDSAPWASLHVIRNRRKLGFAKNHNNAFELSQGKYFAILNPDLIFEAPVFEQLINDLNTYQADLIAPKIVDENGETQDSFRSLPSPYKIIQRRLFGQRVEDFQKDKDGMIKPDWIAGMFWLMNSNTFRQLGGMDEKYRLYFEDVDFCTRARLSGRNILVDSRIQVRHDAKRSSRKSLYYLFLHALSATRFFTSAVYQQALRKK